MKVQVKSRQSLITAAIVTAGITIISFGCIAWAGGPEDYAEKFHGKHETIPAKGKKVQTGKDFDKELRQLDEAVEQLEELKKKDWDKLQRDVERSIKEIDFEKISVDLEQAISKIDMETLGKEIEASLNEIDFDKIEEDIEAALDDIEKIDKQKIKKEIQRARADVENQLKNKEWQAEIEKTKKRNAEEIGKALEEAKQEITKAKEDLKFEKIDLEETMVKAQAEVSKAKEEIKGYQEMVYRMEKEGLLNTDNDYTIEYREGEILINGKKQSSEVNAKYKIYFKKERVTIKKQDGDLDIAD